MILILIPEEFKKVMIIMIMKRKRKSIIYM